MAISARKLRRHAGQVLAAVALGLLLVSLALLPKTTQNSEEFGRLQEVILAINGTGAVVLLVPAYIRAHRELSRMPVDPAEATETSTIPIVGPVDGSMIVDAVVTQPVRVVRGSRLSRLRRR